MIDDDIARFYGVSVKRLNEQVKRNIERFPESFMFQLNDKEYLNLRSQFATIDSKILEKGRGLHRKYLPYVFTEQGVAMLSGVLRSNTAISVSIQIINAFVSMRKFLINNADIFRRLDFIEFKYIEYDKKFEEVFDAIQSKDIIPDKGIFFDGQIFDAYKFVCDIIRSAAHSIILIDNYVDDSILTLFNKRNKTVKVVIFTNKISKQLLLDVNKYNLQYGNIEIRDFDKCHDRFIIIDNKEVYHIGASLKDLGKKWFAFSKFNKDTFSILDKLKF